MAEHGIKYIPITIEELVGKISSHDIVDPSTGEIVAECNEELTQAKLEEIKSKGINTFKVLFIDNLHVTSSFRDTIIIDKIGSTDDALIEIYRRCALETPHTEECPVAVRKPLFQSGAVRSVCSWPIEAQLQAWSSGAAGLHDVDQGRRT